MRLLMVAIAGLLLAGCGSRGDGRGPLRPSEAELAAWWIEDRCHGIPRHPDELRLRDASTGLLALARWAGSPDNPAASVPAPELLRRRAARWPQVARLIADGDAVPERGGLCIASDAAPAARGVLEAELADRAFGDRLAVTVGLADASATRAWAQHAAAARTRLDQPTAAPTP